MISSTPFFSEAPAQLSRRDIIAICAYLNRRPDAQKAAPAIFEQAEGILRELAAAARMQ